MEQKWKKLAGVLVVVVVLVLALLTSAGAGAQTTVPPTNLWVEGWWQLSIFGTSLNQNKERGVVSEEDAWVFIESPTCQDELCKAPQASLSIFRMNEQGWVGYGNLSLPSTGIGVWYYLHFYTGEDYYGSVFYFGEQMEGKFSPDKYDCPLNGDCSLVSFSDGRIVFKR